MLDVMVASHPYSSHPFRPQVFLSHNFTKQAQRDLRQLWNKFKGLPRQMQLGLGVGVVAVVGLLASTLLVQVNQDVRQQASSDPYNLVCCNIGGTQVANVQSGICTVEGFKVSGVNETCQSTTTSTSTTATQTPTAGFNEPCSDTIKCEGDLKCISTPYGRYCRDIEAVNPDTNSTISDNICGDGKCDVYETNNSCPADCKLTELPGITTSGGIAIITNNSDIRNGSVNIGGRCNTTEQCKEDLVCSGGVCKELRNVDPNDDDPDGYSECRQRLAQLGQDYDVEVGRCEQERFLGARVFWSEASCSCILTHTDTGGVNPEALNAGYRPVPTPPPTSEPKVTAIVKTEAVSPTQGWCSRYSPSVNACGNAEMMTFDSCSTVGGYFDLVDSSAAEQGCFSAHQGAESVYYCVTSFRDNNNVVRCNITQSTLPSCRESDGQLYLNYSGAVTACDQLIVANLSLVTQPSPQHDQQVYCAINNGNDCDVNKTTLAYCQTVYGVPFSDSVEGRQAAQQVCRYQRSTEEIMNTIVGNVNIHGDNPLTGGNVPVPTPTPSVLANTLCHLPLLGEALFSFEECLATVSSFEEKNTTAVTAETGSQPSPLDVIGQIVGDVLNTITSFFGGSSYSGTCWGYTTVTHDSQGNFSERSGVRGYSMSKQECQGYVSQGRAFFTESEANNNVISPPTTQVNAEVTVSTTPSQPTVVMPEMVYTSNNGFIDSQAAAEHLNTYANLVDQVMSDAASVDSSCQSIINLAELGSTQVSQDACILTGPHTDATSHAYMDIGNGGIYFPRGDASTGIFYCQTSERNEQNQAIFRICSEENADDCQKCANGYSCC